MEAALGWLGDIFRALLKFFPQLIIVPKTHKGVKFVWGKNVKVIEPGVHWWWPLVTTWIKIPVVRRTMQLPGQALTLNGSTYVLSPVVVYTITDIKKALTEIAFVRQAIEDIVQGCVMEVLMSNPENVTMAREAILLLAQKECKSLGVSVEAIKIVDYAKVIPVRLFNEYAQGEKH